MAELAASRTSAPGGRWSEFEKALQQGELRAVAKQGDHVVSRIAGAAALKAKIKYAGIFVLRTGKERKAFFRHRHTTLISFAGMAELADALDSGSSEVTFVQVQVLLPAPLWV